MQDQKKYVIVKDRHPRISEVLNDCGSGLCVPTYINEPLDSILRKICEKTDAFSNSVAASITQSDINNWNTGGVPQLFLQPGANISITGNGTISTPYIISGTVGYTDEQAQDAVGTILSNEFVYNDNDPSISINQIPWTKIVGAPAESDPIFTASPAFGISGADKTNWNIAYSNQITSASFSGAGVKTLTLNQQDGGTITASFVDVGNTAVTSVGLALPTAVFDITNSPVTNTGTLTGSFKTQVANKVFAGPTTGANAIPTFRSLVDADITSLAWSKITGTPTSLAGYGIPNITVVNGGTGLTTLGSALQYLRVNAGGTALEYATLPTAPSLQAVTTVGNTSSNVIYVTGQTGNTTFLNGLQIQYSSGTSNATLTSATTLGFGFYGNTTLIADTITTSKGTAATGGNLTIQGKLKAVALLNTTTQNRLIGQDSSTNNLDYITIGTGLSLTSGVLTATGVLQPTLYSSDGTLAGVRVVNQNNQSLTFDNVGLFRIQDVGGTTSGVYDFNLGVDFLTYNTTKSLNISTDLIAGMNLVANNLSNSTVTGVNIDANSLILRNPLSTGTQFKIAGFSGRSTNDVLALANPATGEVKWVTPAAIPSTPSLQAVTNVGNVTSNAMYITGSGSGGQAVDGLELFYSTGTGIHFIRAKSANLTQLGTLFLSAESVQIGGATGVPGGNFAVGHTVTFNGLTNATTQDRIVGQTSSGGTSGQLGYITMGTGISLSSGVLSVPTPAWQAVTTAGSTSSNSVYVTNNSNTININGLEFQYSTGTQVANLVSKTTTPGAYGTMVLTGQTVSIASGGQAGGGNFSTAANVSFANLTNASTQDRLIGQTASSSLINYVTIGTGLTLSAGVLSASVTGSGIGRVVTTTAAPLTAGATTQTDYVYFVTGVTTITLPTAVGNTNMYTVIRRDPTNVTTIATTSSQTIDGAATASLNSQYESMSFISNGTNWNTV